MSEEGSKDAPWVLTTPPGGSEFEAYRDEAADPPALVVQVGKTQVRYMLRCIDDLHAMLRDHGDWMPLGNADEQKPAPEGSVEAWAPVGRQPRRWLVRPAQGVPGPVRELCTARPRTPRTGRVGAQPEEQPDASHRGGAASWT